MHELVINDWAELQRELFHDSWNKEIARFRSPFAFRGLGRPDATLETGLLRLGGATTDLEQHLLRNFRKYAHRDVVERDSYWHWLAMAQHHGLPTRLLDWTYSPYVALHFVTANTEMYDIDGTLWMLNFRQAHELLPGTLRDALQREKSDVFTVEMLIDAQQTKRTRHPDHVLAEFDSLAKEPFLLFFEPPSFDDRIVNQYALFSVMSNPCACVSQWLAQHDGLARKLIIPAALKWEIRDKLDQANITERVLFPGLDGLTAWLTRHYLQRMKDESGRLKDETVRMDEV